MHTGLQARLDRLFNRHGDGIAVCVAADHGYMSDVTPNVVQLRPITEAIIRGGIDGVLLSPGQSMRLAPYFQGRDGPALIVRAADCATIAPPAGCAQTRRSHVVARTCHDDPRLRPRDVGCRSCRAACRNS